jgi:hypothetical protein
MKKALALLALPAVLVVQLVFFTPRAAHSAGPPRTATPPGCNHGHPPSKICGSSVTITSNSGMFRVPVANTKLVLQGHAGRSSHGVQIFAQRVTAPHTPAHGIAFRVFSVGHLPALTLVQHGTLYAYSMGGNTWSRARAVTKSGIYAAVVR